MAITVFVCIQFNFGTLILQEFEISDIEIKLQMSFVVKFFCAPFENFDHKRRESGLKILDSCWHWF